MVGRAAAGLCRKDHAEVRRFWGRGIMKISAWVLAAAAVLASSSSVFAANIDLSVWTCKKFQSASDEDVKIILAWLDGYYRNDNDPPVINLDRFVDNAKQLGEYCSANPDMGLITATDKVFK
jgi:acid stress chaperone HdeB